MNLNKLKILTNDVGLNLLATVISTGSQQLIVYPLLAKELGSVEYGRMLTVMGILNVIVLSFGNNLCNARIITEKKYNERNVIGDFQIMALFFGLVSGLCMFVASLMMDISLSIMLGIVVAAILAVFRAYYLVEFRIRIDYKKNLYANVVTAIGFVCGVAILLKFISWPWIFSFSSVVCLLYIGKTSKIIQEPYIKTPLLRYTFKTVMMLIVSGLIGNLTMYMDRFVVYPFLGGEGVSCYSTASFFSKSLSLVLLPITSVLLSYLAVGKIIISKNRYVLINGLLVVVSIIFVFISVTLGSYITGILYPSLIESASPYLFLASLGIIIGIAGSFNGVVVLATAPAYWQVVISITKLVLYSVSSIILLRIYGLYGLCLGVIITNAICFLLNLILGYHFLNKKIK